MKESKRKFFRKWPIRSIEYIFRFSPLWFMFEWGWYEDDEVYIRLWLLFCTLYIKFNVKVKTTFCYWSMESNNLRIEYRQRSFWFILNKDWIKIWYWKKWQWVEGETTKRFYFYDLRNKIFWEPRYSKEQSKRIEFEINVPELNNEKNVITHKYRYNYEVSKWKYLLHTKTRKYTEVESIWDAPKIPWKWTCSYNCGDDYILWFNIKWHVSLAKIKKHIIWDIYYYRSYYPL